MVETKKTTSGESRHQYCYSCVIKYPDQNDRYAAVIARIDDQIAEKDRQIKALGRQQACLSFVWVAWAILMGYLLFAGCSPSTSSPTAPEPGTEEPTPPTPPTTPTTPTPPTTPTVPPPPPPAPHFKITFRGLEDLVHLYNIKGILIGILSAKQRWEEVITEGFPDVLIPLETLQRASLPWSNYTEPLFVDDLTIHFTYGGKGPAPLTLASARAWIIPYLRNDPRLPLIAEITIYDELLKFNRSIRELEMVFVHEIGHALGFTYNTLRDRVGIEVIGDTRYFKGQAAALSYRFVLNRVGQQPAMAGDFVPMADNGSGHWNDSELTWDVMAPHARPTEVLSHVTIGAMRDLGYKVDMLQAEEPSIPPATKLTAVAPHAFCGGGQIHIITP